MAGVPPIVSTEWLGEKLAKNAGSDALRVVDATVWLAGGAKSARPDFEKEHIADKEAVFADLMVALADKDSKVFCMNPGPAQFAEQCELLGIGDTTEHVVIYDRFDRMWSTRFYWMLQSNGFTRASVLDGGWDKWKLEGRPTFSGPGHEYPKGKVKLSVKADPSFWASSTDVKKAVSESGKGACIINALSPENHSGKETSYKRAGHIPTAKNVHFKSLLKDDGSYVDVESLKTKFDFVEPGRKHISKQSDPLSILIALLNA
jgi:thiosulfate/3-mercaptopyruvate sulfurtransferase